MTGEVRGSSAWEASRSVRDSEALAADVLFVISAATVGTGVVLFLVAWGGGDSASSVAVTASPTAVAVRVGF
jgi:hypothetical protein